MKNKLGMLREEVRRYQQITGRSAENVPIIALGAFLDGYDMAINRLRSEIEGTLYIDSLIFGTLIDFRNGKIDADDVIEKFNCIAEKEVLDIINECEEEGEENWY